MNYAITPSRALGLAAVVGAGLLALPAGMAALVAAHLGLLAAGVAIVLAASPDPAH